MNEPRRADLPGQPKTPTSDQLLQRLALTSGVSLRFMRKFVHEMVTIIESGLLRDGVVKIHNFGTFRLSRPPNHSDAAKASRPHVIFQPAPGLRALVNQAFGPPLPFGNPISLPALIEKHLAFQSAPPVWAPPEPAVEKIHALEFDIAEVLPELPAAPPRFDFAETHSEATAPAKQEVEVGELAETPANGRESHDEAPVNEEPVNGKPPIFTFVEPAEETEPVAAPTDSEPDWLAPPTSTPRRHRRFVWYAGAFAIFLLLLLFLLPGRISEKQEDVSHHIAGAPQRPTENTSSPNGTEAKANGQSQVTPVSTTPIPFFPGGTHRVVKGDHLWRLSGNYYRDPYLWPNIYRANTAIIPNPNILELDQQLEVPILHGPAEKLTPADRRNLAEGYFLLYRHYKITDPALAPFALWAAVRYDERIKSAYAAELREDDVAFLRAHEVRQVAER
ncbi:MAG: hypothetical protein ONB46_24610 [candidate division KSB1 bacterium]|nr:hypothetical protein [candidate division KSB1 bacterium]MDZ7369038.1 hypothetical protein [candidate division KSB1 bacterium]MDZ7407038.1 hypothetical protein [candidate division KSB1 bacterium]